MFTPANPVHFRLSPPGFDNDFQVLEFSGRETLDEPYRFDEERGADTSLAKRFGQRLEAAHTPKVGSERTLNGVSAKLNSGGSPGSGTLVKPLRQPTDAVRPGAILTARRQALMPGKPLCAIRDAASKEVAHAPA